MTPLLKLSQHATRKELRQKQQRFLFPGQPMTKIKRPSADWKSYVAEAICYHTMSICFAGWSTASQRKVIRKNEVYWVKQQNNEL
jgi:hypothetical protein